MWHTFWRAIYDIKKKGSLKFRIYAFSFGVHSLLVLLPLIIIPFYAYFLYRPASLHEANGAPLEDLNSGGSCEMYRENTEKERRGEKPW